MIPRFTEVSLPAAVRWLFETNGYNVTGPVEINGAEVDLVASQLAGFAEQRVYIEVTIQNVDVTKYGKDLTKLTMFRNEPGAQRMIVSSAGFTPSVRERAKAEGILTFTYDELFASFERINPYLSHILDETQRAQTLRELELVYEEPSFEDRHGNQKATDYLHDWLNTEDHDRSWLIVVGEYGTGKTALTEVLQRRWAAAYRNGDVSQIPFRIELRDFSRQFDARGLLHHFLDRNDLAHLPVSFVESMIANGRVVLLLDGYDEMAQYLNVRERRACLEALADLARDGAKGILTSRPNYFTEAEELRVFEVLYQRLSSQNQLQSIDRTAVNQEREVDALLEKFVLRRVERSLRDLTKEQTLELVRRRLRDDPAGAEVVTDLLARVFRNDESQEISLAGKPVIITYLLEVVEELKNDQVRADEKRLSEWDIYDLIVTKLMHRDWARTSIIFPSERKIFLQKLALHASLTQRKSLNESAFREVIRAVFESKINRRRAEGATDAEDSLFDDLRSSATLTRCSDQGVAQWQFSHNSLREFLLTSFIVEKLGSEEPEQRSIPITDAMLMFTKSMPKEMLNGAFAQFSAFWPSRESHRGLDQMLTLLWSARRHLDRKTKTVRESLASLVGDSLDLSNCTISNLNFELSKDAQLQRINLSGSILTGVNFSQVDLSDANISGSALDEVDFWGTRSHNANFNHAVMLDCNLTEIDCKGATFFGIDKESTAIVRNGTHAITLDVRGICGYLRRRGAQTDPVDPYYMYSIEPHFDICEKICRVLLDGAWHQRLGLEQRGASEKNVRLARKFVQFLISNGHVQPKSGTGSKLLGATQAGRILIAQLAENNHIDESLLSFFEDNFD